MITSRFIAHALVALLATSATVGCGKKKTPNPVGNFPDSTEQSAGVNADGETLAPGTRAYGSADGAPDAGTLGTEGTVSFDPDTLSIGEPAGKSLGEAGEAVPELTAVYFPLDSYELGESARTLLNRSAAYLQSNPDLYVVLRGHCDDSGTEEYNLALGSQRAQVVRQYLIEKGIGAIRLETLSFGESMPAVEGTDEGTRAQNRRVEFFVFTIVK